MIYQYHLYFVFHTFSIRYLFWIHLYIQFQIQLRFVSWNGSMISARDVMACHGQGFPPEKKPADPLLKNTGTMCLPSGELT